MITIYTSPSCSSCKKVKNWFNEMGIPFKEKNIFGSVLNPAELKDILAKSENGTDDIISKRSNIIKNSNIFNYTWMLHINKKLCLFSHIYRRRLHV